MLNLEHEQVLISTSKLLSCYSFMPQMQQRLNLIIVYVWAWIFIYILCDIFVCWNGNLVRATVYLFWLANRCLRVWRSCWNRNCLDQRGTWNPNLRIHAECFTIWWMSYDGYYCSLDLNCSWFMLNGILHFNLNCSFLLLIYFSVHIWCLFCNLQLFAYAIVIWFMSCIISQYMRVYVGMCL